MSQKLTDTETLFTDEDKIEVYEFTGWIMQMMLNGNIPWNAGVAIRNFVFKKAGINNLDK